MNESTKTKKALRSSLFALFLCIVLLIGTTFAWFTDTASTGVNKIQAGNLKVDIVKASDGQTSLKGDKMSFTNVNGSDEILWEPGVRFKTPAFKIKNDGNLALKYKMSLNGITGDKELLDVITFSVVDKDGNAVDLDTFEGHLEGAQLSEELYIEGHMDESAGNEYQDKALEGMAITVTATQDTVENDSFDNTYDQDAAYHTTVVTSDSEFTAALKQAKETKGMTIMLKKGTYGSIDVPVLKEGEKLSGLTIVAENGVTIDAFRIVSPADYLTVENLTLKNLKFVGEGFLDRTPTDGLSVIGCKFVGSETQFKTQVEPKKNVRIENCYFDNEGSANTFSSIYFEKGVQNLVIKGTTIKNSGFNAISLQSTNADYRSGGDITIANNTMTNIPDRVIRMNGVAADAKITIKGNTMATKKAEWFKASLMQKGASVHLTDNNTVNGSKISNSDTVSNGNDIAF